MHLPVATQSLKSAKEIKNRRPRRWPEGQHYPKSLFQQPEGAFTRAPFPRTLRRGTCNLLSARGRNNAIHAEVLDHLSVVIVRVANDADGKRKTRGHVAAEWTLDGF